MEGKWWLPNSRLFPCWPEGTEEHHYKLWPRGQNSNLKQAAYKTPAHIVAGAGGISVHWMLLASPTAVCVVRVRTCVCVCV
jgi:hypothetical protein